MTILRHPLSMFVLLLGAIWFVGTAWSAMLPVKLEPITFEAFETRLFIE